eukprot:362872-Chlamydomonas_euryale.AAC.5
MSQEGNAAMHRMAAPAAGAVSQEGHAALHRMAAPSAGAVQSGAQRRTAAFAAHSGVNGTQRRAADLAYFLAPPCRHPAAAAEQGANHQVEAQRSCAVVPLPFRRILPPPTTAAEQGANHRVAARRRVRPGRASMAVVRRCSPAAAPRRPCEQCCSPAAAPRQPCEQRCSPAAAPRRTALRAALQPRSGASTDGRTSGTAAQRRPASLNAKRERQRHPPRSRAQLAVAEPEGIRTLACTRPVALAQRHHWHAGQEGKQTPELRCAPSA